MSDDVKVEGGEETMWDVLWRGVKGFCPNCGEGKLFGKYITQNEACSVCAENLSSIRADDAPPWLTILITGHLVFPFIHHFAKHDYLSEGAEMAIILAVVLLCVFFILPWAKGFFIAAIWRQERRKALEE